MWVAAEGGGGAACGCSASRGRRRRGLGAAAPLRHVQRRVGQLGREVMVPSQEGIKYKIFVKSIVGYRSLNTKFSKNLSKVAVIA